MPRALIGLGSNLGDRRATLDAATAQLAGAPQTTLVAASSWYETVAVGGPLGQDPFLNGCLLLETALAPEALLDRLLEIETALGRVREIPWGPRTLDLDLLLYDDAIIHSPRLTVPHPRLAYRKFVLHGATAIAAAMRHPLLDRTLGELADHLQRTPRYVGMTGLTAGFRTQFAGEAAHAAAARLVDATPAGIAASVEELIGSHSLTAEMAIEFLRARTEAVAQSVADAGEAWVVDDAWPAAEAVQIVKVLDGDPAAQARFRDAARQLLTIGVTPRLVVGLDRDPHDAPRNLHRTDPQTVVLPPLVAVDIADRETALNEIAAALSAAE